MEHMFRKIAQTSGLKVKKGVGYIKMSSIFSLLCRIHFQGRARRPPVVFIHTFVAFFHHTRSDNCREHGWRAGFRAEHLDQMLAARQ